MAKRMGGMGRKKVNEAYFHSGTLDRRSAGCQSSIWPAMGRRTPRI